MARVLCTILLVAACAAAQTVEGSVFDAATGVGAGGVKVELLKGATPFYETTTDGGDVSGSTTSRRETTRSATSRRVLADGRPFGLPHVSSGGRRDR